VDLRCKAERDPSPTEGVHPVEPDEVRTVMDHPVAQRLLASPIPARLAYIARNGTPRVYPSPFTERPDARDQHRPRFGEGRRDHGESRRDVDHRHQPSRLAPNVLVRGTAEVSLVNGVFPEYVAGARKVTPTEEFPQWEAGVYALYDQMAPIAVTPTWATVHDFETRIPQAVADLATAKFGGQ
jgi:hypothetical protein